MHPTWNPKHSQVSEILVKTISISMRQAYANRQKSPAVVEEIIGQNIKKDEASRAARYFVKFKSRPYSECVWVTESELSTQAKFDDLMKVFTSSMAGGAEVVPFIEDLYKPVSVSLKASFFQPEAVVLVNQMVDQFKFLVKWKDLPLSASTWEEDAPAELREAYERSVAKLNPRTGQVTDAFQKRELFSPHKESPVYRGGFKLSMRALDTLNWMTCNWRRGLSSVLFVRDEGLRRIACVAFLTEIQRITRFMGPFLVAVPLSQAGLWRETFEKMTEMRVVSLCGDETERTWIRECAIFADMEGQQIKADVVIVSTVSNQDWQFLSNIGWLAVIVDEEWDAAHKGTLLTRMKSNVSTAYTALLCSKRPDQIDVQRLYALLSFLDDRVFSSESRFCSRFVDNGVLKTTAFFSECADYVRYDQDVVSWYDKAPKIVAVAQSSLQKSIIRDFLMSSARLLLLGIGFGPLVQKLRRVSNHPFLQPAVREKYVNAESSPENLVEQLMMTSGKFYFIRKLLDRAKEHAQKVMVIASSKEVTNLLEEFLSAAGFSVTRMDGTCDHLASGSSSVYLLTGDTMSEMMKVDIVVYFDSLRATPSLVESYVLVTRGTVEEGLHRLILADSPFTSTALEQALRETAQFVFSDFVDAEFFREDLSTILSNRMEIREQEVSNVQSRDFWQTLFVGLQKGSPNLGFNPDLVQGTIERLRLDGYLRQASMSPDISLLCQVIMMYAYTQVSEQEQQSLKQYMSYILNDGTADASRVSAMATQFPFNSKGYMDTIFPGDCSEFLRRVMVYDRLHRAVSWMSTAKDISYGLSAQMPMEWTPVHDYCLLYAQRALLRARNSPTRRRPTLEKSFEMLLGKMDERFQTARECLEFMSPGLLEQRVKLLIAEIEESIPPTYTAFAEPAPPWDWVPLVSAKRVTVRDSHVLVRRVIYCLYRYAGYRPTELIMLKHLETLPVLHCAKSASIAVALRSVMEKCASVFPSSVQPTPMQMSERIDISWIGTDVILELARELDLQGRATRLLSSCSGDEFDGRWRQVMHGSFGNQVSLWKLLHAYTVDGIKAAAKLCGASTGTGPECLDNVHDLIVEIVSSFSKLDNATPFIHPDRDVGLMILRLGKMDQFGVPIGYWVQRFYRDCNTRDKTIAVHCSIGSDSSDQPVFNIRVNPKTIFSTASLPLTYKHFLEWAMENSVSCPPEHAIKDGYSFFGLTHPFVRDLIKSAASKC